MIEEHGAVSSLVPACLCLKAYTMTGWHKWQETGAAALHVKNIPHSAALKY